MGCNVSTPASNPEAAAAVAPGSPAASPAKPQIPSRGLTYNPKIDFRVRMLYAELREDTIKKITDAFYYRVHHDKENPEFTEAFSMHAHRASEYLAWYCCESWGGPNYYSSKRRTLFSFLYSTHRLWFYKLTPEFWNLWLSHFKGAAEQIMQEQQQGLTPEEIARREKEHQAEVASEAAEDPVTPSSAKHHLSERKGSSADKPSTVGDKDKSELSIAVATVPATPVLTSTSNKNDFVSLQAIVMPPSPAPDASFPQIGGPAHPSAPTATTAATAIEKKKEKKSNKYMLTREQIDVMMYFLLRLKEWLNCNKDQIDKYSLVGFFDDPPNLPPGSKNNSPALKPFSLTTPSSPSKTFSLPPASPKK